MTEEEFTPEELAAAEALRKALEEDAPSEDADLLRALKHAHDPSELEGNDALVERALRQKKPERRGVVLRVAFGVAAAVAIAAGAVVVVKNVDAPKPTANIEFKRVRSTQELFDKKFETGETSARVDKIAMARGNDLRDNRFARWGVR